MDDRVPTPGRRVRVEILVARTTTGWDAAANNINKAATTKRNRVVSSSVLCA